MTESPEGVDDKHIEVRPIFRVAQLVIGVALAVLAFWLASDTRAPTGIALNGFYGFVALAFGIAGWWRLIRPKPALSLLSDGLLYRTLIPWTAITGVKDADVAPFARINLRLTREYAEKIKAGNTASIPTWALAIGTIELVALIDARRKREL